MRNASGHQGENERQWKKSEKERVRKFPHKTCNQEVSGTFRKFHVVQKNGKEMYKKRVLHVQSCLLLIRPIVVFSPFSLPSPLSIARYYILFEQTINIIESFAFRHGLIYILVYTKPVCVSSDEQITYRLYTAIVTHRMASMTCQ